MTSDDSSEPLELDIDGLNTAGALATSPPGATAFQKDPNYDVWPENRPSLQPRGPVSSCTDGDVTQRDVIDTQITGPTTTFGGHRGCESLEKEGLACRAARGSAS